MNINLIYQNNTFNFDLRKDITINYLEELASKLINKDKSSFELFFKDYNLSDYRNSLLKEFVESESNISILISPKLKRQNIKTNNKLPKIKLSKSLKVTSLDKNNDHNLNKTEAYQALNDNSINDISDYSKNNISMDIKRKRVKKFNIENKVFKDIYDNKENDLISLMKNLSQKIKEYDDILFKKYKNNSQNNKKRYKELLLYEKNIIDFKNKQLEFIKNLINHFDNKEKNDNFEGIINLNEFYKELRKFYNNNNIFSKKNNNTEQNLLYQTIRNENNIINNDKELPLLTSININEPQPIKKLYLSQNKVKSNVTIIKNELLEKNNKPLFKSEKKISKKNIKERNKQNFEDKLFENINTQENNVNNANDNKKFEIQKYSLCATTNANTNQSESSTFSKNQDKNKNTNNKNNNNNHSNNSNNNIQTIKPKKLENENINNINNNINNNNYSANRNYNINNKDSNNKSKNLEDIKPNRRRNSIEDIEYDKNKLFTLFEIAELQKKNYNESESNSSGSNESNSSKNSVKDSNELSVVDDVEEKENNSDDIKHLKSNFEQKKSISKKFGRYKSSKNGFLMNNKIKKMEKKEKRLGNNMYDFLI